MKLWIARDDDGSLWLYNMKPCKNKNLKRFTCTMDENGHWSEEYKLDSNSFPSVTFENSPQRVEIKLI